ncbi:SEL1-like repeat protein [Budvicia aquatica]|uniref:Uncharacterized protein n=1 Tax=Budvicia aquatica TaxID=82979 RepID=A0A484ZTH4_9GAMM|nr:sel1 repeat family protein [Budvicia aquatica]VFS51812.1 Uncharacterised protein [Budvicia aquatica]
MGNKDRYYIVALSIFTLLLGGCVPVQQAKSPTFKPTIKSTDKSMLGGLQQYMAALEQQGEKGDIAAQRQLGAMFSASGNSEQADRWLRLSAESGDADAQAKLGDIYTASSQYDEALNWYTNRPVREMPRLKVRLPIFISKAGEPILIWSSQYIGIIWPQGRV